MSKIAGVQSQLNFDAVSPTTETQVTRLANHELHNEEKNETNNGRLTTEEQSQLETAVDTINQTLDAFDRGLKFSIHEDTNRIMVKVVDRSNFKEEVIREIPPEKILDMLAEVLDMIGLLIDQRA